MTELLTLDRLREIVHVTGEPSLPPPRPIVVLHWTIDVETGRPVGSWVLEADRA